MPVFLPVASSSYALQEFRFLVRFSVSQGSSFVILCFINKHLLLLFHCYYTAAGAAATTSSTTPRICGILTDTLFTLSLNWRISKLYFICFISIKQKRKQNRTSVSILTVA